MATTKKCFMLEINFHREMFTFKIGWTWTTGLINNKKNHRPINQNAIDNKTTVLKSNTPRNWRRPAQSETIDEYLIWTPAIKLLTNHILNNLWMQWTIVHTTLEENRLPPFYWYVACLPWNGLPPHSQTHMTTLPCAAYSSKSRVFYNQRCERKIRTRSRGVTAVNVRSVLRLIETRA